MKKIISILLILALFLSFIPLNSSLSGEVTPPEGFKFSNEYQRIPVTLDKATYYAYQIEKNDGKQKVTGWLIVDSNNKTVSDQSAYTKLALAATVTKYIEENPTISTIMKSDLDMLHNLKWKMALYEVSQALIKTVSSGIGAMATGKPPTGAFEEVVSMASFVPQAAAIELSDKYLDEFTHWTANTFYETLIKTGEIKGDLSSGSNIFKFCGVLQSIIRKGALISAKKGIDSYNESYDIFKNHTGPWSYEDAQKFLEGYTKGKAQAVAYGSWYLRLIPHNSNMWFNIGSTVWDNVVKQVLPAKIEDITNAADAVTKFVPLFIKIVKESPDKLVYNQVEEDIKNMSSLLNIFRLLYNTSIKDSPANIIFNAITEGLRGTLSVTSNPKNAKVYVNGEYEGITPIDITLTPGKYSVKITKEGYKDFSGPITIQERETKNVSATLTKELAYLFKIGDHVQATDYLNVREQPSLKSKIKAVVPKESIGDIKSKFKIADGHYWWIVEWSNGITGWSAGEYIELYTGKFPADKGEETPKKWVLILAQSLQVLDGPDPTGKALVGNYRGEGIGPWELLTCVYSGDLLEYIDESYYTTYSLWESFPQCLKAFKVKTKDGEIGWVIASWSGGLLEDEIELAKVVTEKTSYSVNPVTFGDVSGKWTGYYEQWTGWGNKEKIEFRINIDQSDDTLCFSGTSSEILNGETKTANIGGSLFKNKIYFIKYYPDGNWIKYQGTVSQDGKSAEGNIPMKWFISREG